METKKEYATDEITIIWQPQLCRHAGICVQMLPQVYNPGERPWIKPHNATVAQLVEQVNRCPSGALAYRIDDRAE